MKTAHTSFSSSHHFFFLFFLLSPNGPQAISHITLLSFANSCSSHQCLIHINSLLVCFYVCLFFTLFFQSKSLSTFQFVFFPVYIFKFLFKKSQIFTASYLTVISLFISQPFYPIQRGKPHKSFNKQIVYLSQFSSSDRGVKREHVKSNMAQISQVYSLQMYL